MLFLKITDRDLPTLPVVASQALELINRDDATNKQIEELIRLDPALTQRLLTTANSPFYCGKFPIRSISEAVSRMGLRQLRNLVLIAATGELFNGDDPVLQQLWRHSIASAIAAHAIAGMVAGVNPEEAFISGMLHDVGKVILYRQFKELYGGVIDDAREQGVPMHLLEEKRFQDLTHMSVGGMVIKKWKLSDAVADTACFHHSLESGPVAGLANPALAAVVSIASILVNNAGVGPLGEGAPESAQVPLDDLYCLRILGLEPRVVEELAPKIREKYEAQLAMLA